jgi:hypothetical protein
MTIRFSLDLKKSLTDNVRALSLLCFEECSVIMREECTYKPIVVISRNDFCLLSNMYNSFHVTGLDLFKKLNPEVSFHFTSDPYDAEVVREHLDVWRSHGDHVASENSHRQMTLARMSRTDRAFVLKSRFGWPR